MAILNHMSDIPYSKKTTEVDPYIEAFDINNDNIDFDVLNNYKESNYVYNADNLDELSDSINIMQNNWNNDVIRDLSNKYNLYQSWINNLKSATKSWQSGDSNLYYKNDIVTYVNDDGAIFLCIQDCNGSEPLPDASNPVNNYWVRFDSKGEPGENSCDLQWRGEWNIENTYSVKDVVWYSPNSTSTLFYVCIKTASGQQILDVNYWISFYSIWMDDRIDSYNNMPNQDWFDDDYNPTIFYIRHNDETSNRPVIQFVNRVESESASNPAYVDMGSDISSLLIYFNESSRNYQLLTDVWDSFIKSNNLYSNVRR